MKINDAMLAQFHLDHPLQYVSEREGADKAFSDLKKNGRVSVVTVGKTNPYQENQQEFYDFRHGYVQFVYFYQSMQKTLAETKTTHQRKNAFGGVYAS